MHRASQNHTSYGSSISSPAKSGVMTFGVEAVGAAGNVVDRPPAVADVVLVLESDSHGSVDRRRHGRDPNAHDRLVLQAGARPDAETWRGAATSVHRHARRGTRGRSPLVAPGSRSRSTSRRARSRRRAAPSFAEFRVRRIAGVEQQHRAARVEYHEPHDQPLDERQVIGDVPRLSIHGHGEALTCMETPQHRCAGGYPTVNARPHNCWQGVAERVKPWPSAGQPQRGAADQSRRTAFSNDAGQPRVACAQPAASLCKT